LLLLIVAAVVAGCTGTGADGSTGGTGQGATGFVDVTAHAGPIVAVRAGNLAILDGTGSKAPGQQQIFYAWRMVSKPTGSTAQIPDLTSATPSFIADLEGIYTVELIVTAGGVPSARTVGIVVATIAPARATGPKDHLTLSSNCINCHNGSPSTSGEKSADHMAATNLCQACHSPLGFTNIAYVDHLEVFGNCSTCHNGVTAIGKSSQHVPTEEECSDCHNTEGFLILELDGSFDHTGVNQGCDVCHNGIVATGKHATHKLTHDNCHLCHNTVDFADATFDHSDIITTCEFCHNGTDSIGKDSAANHPVTTADCGNCHNTTNFAETFVDHTSAEVLSQRCDSCHDNVTSRGLTPTHMPINIPGSAATNDCGVCHTPGAFTTGTFDHIAVTATNCISCHDGIISTGQDADHVATTQQCSVCHGSTTSFTESIAFNHLGVDTSNCAACHDGLGSTGKSDTHIPTIENCDVCHVGTNPGDFATAPLFLTDVHPNLVSGCEGCHNDVMLPNFSKSAKVGEEHVPTAQDCRFCHVNTNFLPTIFTHNGIIDNCASCHDGNHDLSGAIGVDADHIITTQDCGVCHTTTNDPLTGAPSFLNAVFDHTGIVDNCSRSGCHGNGAIGKDADHVPTTEDCSVCHVTSGFANAVFDHQGIVDNCASCHDGVTATGMSIDHPPIQIGQDCSVCHNTTAFAGAAFDHTGITGNCASCHNGTQATGKHNDHVPTNDDCVNCHNTAGFIPATFDHQGIVDNCQSCHNDIFAIGKSSALNHPPTNEDCGVCHNTNSFADVVFDHTGINSDCARSGCHGSGATGKPNTHVPTNLDCSFCHTTATFVGGTWDHTGITGNCISCHDGSTATGKGNGHFQTNEDCNACHRTTGWAPVDYNHPNNSDYPGDHNGNVGCVSCHRQNNANITFQFNYPGTCAACHANDFDAGEHNGGLNNNLNCGNSGCHRVSDRNWD
jgi:hypothetical protein